MKLGELVEGLDVRVIGGDGLHCRVCDVTEDSRTTLPGSLFIARPGLKSDGRSFIADAVAAGASVILGDASLASQHLPHGVTVVTTGDVPLVSAIVAERFYGAPTSKFAVVGITGTNGKTTTAHAVHRLLNSARIRCGLIGTVQIDDGRELSDAVMTTPPACELSNTFATMLDAGCTAAAMEVSSHALHQRRVGALRFSVGVFTNLTGDHLDYHGTMAAYADAKAMLFDSLAPDATAVVNIDDPAYTRMIRGCRATILRCTVDPAKQAECRAVGGACTLAGTRVEYSGPWGSFETTISMVGRHNLMNTLQAIAAGWSLGLTLEQLKRAAPLMEPPPGRLERVSVPGQGDFAVFVDYAHTDDALRNVLGAMRPLVSAPGAKLRVVFGCGGDRDRTKRPRMGRAACELADDVVITSDNPRTEQPGAIIDEVLKGVPASDRGKVRVDADRAVAIRKGVESCRPGDALVIAGKGHETYQILPDGKGGSYRIDFDDRLVAREALLDATDKQAALTAKAQAVNS